MTMPRRHSPEVIGADHVLSIAGGSALAATHHPEETVACFLQALGPA
jgi:hypothetical protein